MTVNNFVVSFLIIFSSIACKIKTKDKFIGAWIVKEVNIEDAQNTHEGGILISFIEDFKFLPGNGTWSFVEDRDKIYLTIHVEERNVADLKGTYLITFTPETGNSPSYIFLEPVTDSNNRYILERLTFDFQKYH